ncbi:MAG: radical SAM protein [Armatimonadota bacterium]
MHPYLFQKLKSKLDSEQSRISQSTVGIRTALVYPNTYKLGMSSLGYQIIYEMINSMPIASCERVFLPDADELRIYKNTKTEITSLESSSKLNEFDVIAFSLHFELDYTNILKILDMGNVPFKSSARTIHNPIVIAGGPAVTINPEPVADFFDAIVIGDGEECITQIYNSLYVNQDKDRKEVLRELSKIEGVYVPSLYEPQYSKDGIFTGIKALDGAPEIINKSTVKNLSKYPNSSCIITKEAEFGEINLIEIGRGCGRGCRFCAAGFINRPLRSRNVEIKPNSRYGLVGAAVYDNSSSKDLCEKIINSDGSFSISSMRLETLTDEIAKLLKNGGQKTVTIAPEAGSQRLRNIINKPATEEDILSAVKSAVNAGIANIKMYFMIGLPFETNEDVEEIVRLVKKVKKNAVSTGLHMSVSSFVPKPHTPFQWHPMEQVKTLRKRYAYLKKELPSIGGVNFGGESPRLSIVQGVLSRGDRRLGKAIIYAYKNNDDYAQGFREANIDINYYIYRKIDNNTQLPWNHINSGVFTEYLWIEYNNSMNNHITSICDFNNCQKCGACK